MNMNTNIDNDMSCIIVNTGEAIFQLKTFEMAVRVGHAPVNVI